MANKNFLARLKSVKGYSQAVKESETSGFETLPDARYEAKIVSAEIGESKSSGRLQAVVRMMIVNHEEFDGQKTAEFLGLEGDGLVITLRKIRVLGFELEGNDPSELLGIVEEIGKSEMIVKIQVKNGFAGIIGKSDEDPYIVNDNDDDSAEADDESQEEEESEEVEESKEEVLEGSKVKWTSKDGKEKTGEVIEILDETQMARVECDGKIVRIPLASLEVISESSEEVEEEEIVEEEEEIVDDVEESEEEEEDTTTRKTKKKPMAKKPAKKEVKKVAKKK